VTLDAIGKHAAMHLMRLSQVPQRQREFKVFKAEFDKLGKVTEQIREMAEQAQPQQQNGEPTEAQIKAAKVTGDLQLKKERQDAQIALKAQNQAFQQRAKAQDQQFQHAIADADLAHTIRSDVRKSKAEMAAVAAEDGE